MNRLIINSISDPHFTNESNLVGCSILFLIRNIPSIPPTRNPPVSINTYLCGLSSQHYLQRRWG